MSTMTLRDWNPCKGCSLYKRGHDCGRYYECPMPEMPDLLLGNSPSPGSGCGQGTFIPIEVLIDALRLRGLDGNILQKVLENTRYASDEQTLIGVLRARGWKGELRQEYNVVI